jgi:large subunit ribosomal protein L19
MSQYLQYNDQTITVGDTIRVHQRIMEEKKSRVQVFEGVVIAIRGNGNGKSFIVRKLGAAGIGVEKILPVNLPSIEKIEVKRQGQTRRSKLYFLRERIGKAATKVKEKATVFETTKTA